LTRAGAGRPGLGLRRALQAAVATLALAVPAISAATAQAGWSRPFNLAPPGSLDVVGPQLTYAPTGAAAAAFGTENVDTPGSSQGFLTLRSAGGAVGAPVQIGGASQILSLAYNGRSLELLTGTTPAGTTCCSTAQAIAVDGGGNQARPRTLVGGLAGATLGQLVALPSGQMLAAIGTERGVWAVQSSRGNRFTGQRLLSARNQMPESLAAAALGGGASIVAWTSATGTAGGADPRTIYAAEGSRRGAPAHARAVVTVAPGHRIDEIGVAPRAGTATVAWIESWYDRSGSYHSEAMAMDDAPHASARALSPAGRLASGLTFAGDLAGDQAVSWESCTVNDACSTDVAARRAKGAFGPARSLGATDPAQAPALAVGAHGQAVVIWIHNGDPMGAVQASPGHAFGSPSVISAAGYALNITVAAGPHGRAMAAWSQGTLNPSVVGAEFGG
jgi:hypothetical protein